MKDTKKKTFEIDLLEDGVYLVIDGKLQKVDEPGSGFGKQIINWQNGKPTHYEVSYTVKRERENSS